MSSEKLYKLICDLYNTCQDEETKHLLGEIKTIKTDDGEIVFVNKLYKNTEKAKVQYTDGYLENIHGEDDIDMIYKYEPYYDNDEDDPYFDMNPYHYDYESTDEEDSKEMYNEYNHYWLEGDDVYRVEIVEDERMIMTCNYKNDNRHNLNNAYAESVIDGNKIMVKSYKDGKLHSINGPAFQFVDHDKNFTEVKYYIEGQVINEQDFNRKVDEYKQQNPEAIELIFENI